MNTIFNRLMGIKSKPKKQRVWYYQFPNEREEQLYKDGKYWYYESKISGRIGNSTLAGAKGDLIYSGAKVWNVLEDL